VEEVKSYSLDKRHPCTADGYLLFVANFELLLRGESKIKSINPGLHGIRNNDHACAVNYLDALS